MRLKAPTPVRRPRILLLHDELEAAARVDAADVAREAEHVAGALEALGYEAIVERVGLDLAALLRRIERLRPHVVFNLVESLGGHAPLIAAVPSLLEARGIPFTGCPADAQYLSSNKRLAKRRLAAAGIATPAEFEASVRVRPASLWIAKSVWEHASLGIDDDSVVSAEAVAPLLARRAAEHGGRWFAEAFVAGRELNVTLLSRQGRVAALPPAEIRFDAYPEGKPRIVGYAAKWRASSFEYRHTPRSFEVEAGLAAEISATALACWEAFGLEGYARVDFRVDAAGTPWVLEVNANPCLSADAGFAAALESAGIAFPTAVSWLLEDALARAPASAGEAFRPRDVQHS